MTTRIVNVTRSACDVPITRSGADGGLYGNPVRLTVDTPLNRTLCLLAFLRYFRHRCGLKWDAGFQHKGIAFADLDYRMKVDALKGKTLGCVCKPLLCHGDVYAAYLDRGPAELDVLEGKLEEMSKVQRNQ